MSDGSEKVNIGKDWATLHADKQATMQYLKSLNKSMVKIKNLQYGSKIKIDRQ